jgi:hypothetical protein
VNEDEIRFPFGAKRLFIGARWIHSSSMNPVCRLMSIPPTTRDDDCGQKREQKMPKTTMLRRL